MKSILRHRIIGLALAGIFAIFNVGLPIVVASCPMLRYSDSSACMACSHASIDGTTRITNSVDKSCCTTKYAADKNKNEFLKTDPQSVESVKFIAITEMYIVPQAVINAPQFVILSHASPPGSTDIPIFISSLLI